MKRTLLEVLPPGTQLSADAQDGEIVCGRLTGSFGTAPIIDGVPRFVPSEAYTGSFGRQWSRFARVQLDSQSGRDDSYRSFAERTGIEPEELAGKRVLDVGCGAGRYTELFANARAEVVGVDLSRAADVAWSNVGLRPGVNIAQADALQLPFRQESFDLVFSIGVLHHTPHAEQAAKGLARLVRPGGTLAIWVYVRSPFSWADALDSVYRSVTRRWPDELLYRFAHVAIPLGALLRRVATVPRVGPKTVAAYSTIFPKVSMHPDPQWRVLDTFDWWSPQYRSFHTYSEVESWFREAGLVDIQRLAVPVAVRGMKSR